MALATLQGCDSRTATQIGEDLAQEKVDLVKGAGEVVKNEGEGVADTVAQGVGNIITGLTSGLDKSLSKIDIQISGDIDSQTLVAPRAQGIQSTVSEPRSGLSVYLKSELGFNGKITLVAISDDGEVGRSEAEVSIEKSGADYFDFEFDKRTPLNIVKYYSLEKSGEEVSIPAS